MGAMTTIHLIIGAVIALIGAGGLVRWLSARAGKKPAAKPVPPAPPEPEHTAEEHTNESIDDAIEAVVEAAAEHNVDVGTVADDLDWLGADDV